MQIGFGKHVKHIRQLRTSDHGNAVVALQTREIQVALIIDRVKLDRQSPVDCGGGRRYHGLDPADQPLSVEALVTALRETRADAGADRHAAWT